jgi:hypothetical protein
MTISSPHAREIERLRTRYERLGFVVVVNPDVENLPFELGAYRPDLVARKMDGSGGYIVEVKESSKKISVDRLTEIATQVRGHAGWRFVLATLDDIAVPEGREPLPSWSVLASQLSQVDVVSKIIIEPAILYLYALFEGACRRLAIEQAIPIERFQSTRIRNSLYTLGWLDAEEYKLCKNFLAMRNLVAHGFVVNLDKKLVEEFRSFCTKAIAEWSNAEAPRP